MPLGNFYVASADNNWLVGRSEISEILLRNTEGMGESGSLARGRQVWCEYYNIVHVVKNKKYGYKIMVSLCGILISSLAVDTYYYYNKLDTMFLIMTSPLLQPVTT